MSPGLIVVLVLAGLFGIMIPVAGILAAIAIPNFIIFQSRSKQAEVKANLRAAYTAERACFEVKNTFSSSPEEVGFVPERGNRYAYLFDQRGPLLERRALEEEPMGPGHTGIDVDRFKYQGLEPFDQTWLKATYAGEARLGVKGRCPDCGIVIAAVGNIDNDPDLDVWSIATFPRTGPKGESIPAGVPFNDLSDL